MALNGRAFIARGYEQKGGGGGERNRVYATNQKVQQQRGEEGDSCFTSSPFALYNVLICCPPRHLTQLARRSLALTYLST